MFMSLFLEDLLAASLFPVQVFVKSSFSPLILFPLDKYEGICVISLHNDCKYSIYVYKSWANYEFSRRNLEMKSLQWIFSRFSEHSRGKLRSSVQCDTFSSRGQGPDTTRPIPLC